jgi:dynamin 1-like protein
MVYDELVRILGQLLTRQFFKRFPSLKEKFYSVVLAYFKKALQPTSKLVTNLVMMESSYINTGHPDFLSGHQAIAIVNERMHPKTENQQQQQKKPTSALQTNGQQQQQQQQEEGNSLFGSFFSGNKKSPVKKTTASMFDAVSI